MIMKVLFTLLAAVMVLSVHSQIVTPAPSPFCKIEQKLGLGTVTIEYSRPSMKNRTIFGDLVPYGKLWRTGANRSTVITFSENVKIEGKELAKGSYSLYTIPGEKSWDIIFYNQTNIGGTPDPYEPSKEVVKVQAMPEMLTTSIETFTIDLNNIKMNSGTLYLMWENTAVGVNVTTDVETPVMKNIDKVLAGPSSDDYYLAARYYLDSGKDLNKALPWIQKATSMEPKYWKIRVESLILGKLGRIDEAIAAAEKSKALAMEDHNDDYVKMNNDYITELKLNKPK